MKFLNTPRMAWVGESKHPERLNYVVEGRSDSPHPSTSFIPAARKARPPKVWRGHGCFAHAYLYLVVALFVAVALAYSLNTPLLEGSDEPQHYEYVLSIARGEGLPLTRIDGKESITYEAHQPPLYYAASALATFWIDASDYGALGRVNPYTDYDPLALSNKNLFLHARRETFPFRGVVLAMRVARLVSIAFGIGAIIATFGLAKALFPSRPEIWSGAAAFVAFLPQFGFVSGVVGNDSAVACMVALALWQLARVARLAHSRRLTMREFALLGLLLGLAPLAKESGLAAVAVAPLALTLVVWTSGQWRVMLRGALTTFVVVALVVGWWYVLRHAVFGFWLGNPESAAPIDQPLSFEGLLAQWTELEISFWGLFGWNIVPLPQIAYDGLHGLTLFALGGFILAFVRRKEWTRLDVAATVGLVLYSLFVLIAFWHWMTATAQAHGRLLFPALPCFAIGVCLGLSQWLPRRWRPAMLSGLAAVLFALSGWAATSVLGDSYPQPRILASAELIPHRINANLDDHVALLGYDMRPRPPAERNVVDVVVYWQTTAPMDVDYTVTVQAFDKDGTRIGHYDAYPVSGMYLTRDWNVGEILQDRYPLELDADAGRPIHATMVVGLYDRRTGKALQVIQPDGRRVARVTLGQVEIR